MELTKKKYFSLPNVSTISRQKGFKDLPLVQQVSSKALYHGQTSFLLWQTAECDLKAISLVIAKIMGEFLFLPGPGPSKLSHSNEEKRNLFIQN